MNVRKQQGMSYTDDGNADPSCQAFCCGFFTGVAGIVTVSVLVARVLNTHSECDMVRKDFAYLGTTCNITNISHVPIDKKRTYCKDGTEASYGGYGTPDDYDGCGPSNEGTELSGCEDKFTVYFTAEEDNHSAVHTILGNEGGALKIWFATTLIHLNHHMCLGINLPEMGWWTVGNRHRL